MTAKQYAPRGYFYEDFTVGDVLRTGRRTVTETDIVNFACLSGDFNDVHCNHEYARQTIFGEPIAHGPLVFAIAAGLNYASGMNDGTLVAMLGIDKWRMLEAVKAGDTIQVESTVLFKRRSASQPGTGVVRFARRFLNQHGRAAQEMEITILYKCKNKEGSD